MQVEQKVHKEIQDLLRNHNRVLINAVIADLANFNGVLGLSTKEFMSQNEVIGAQIVAASTVVSKLAQIAIDAGVIPVTVIDHIVEEGIGGEGKDLEDTGVTGTGPTGPPPKNPAEFLADAIEAALEPIEEEPDEDTGSEQGTLDWLDSLTPIPTEPESLEPASDNSEL